MAPRRSVVERSFAWASRSRRPVRDRGRPPESLRGLRVVAFATLMLAKATVLLDLVHNSP